jgi:YesN/AraC family two-component response regulator
MPGMNGHELVTRSTKIRPTLKHLFISGHSHHFYERKGILEENAPFLLKPFSRTALGHKVHEILNAPVSASG